MKRLKNEEEDAEASLKEISIDFPFFNTFLRNRWKSFPARLVKVSFTIWNLDFL